MLNKKDNIAVKNIEFACVEQLVPKDHILRDIDKAIDFSFVYDLVKDLYSEENGRPSIDPVVLIKMELIQYLFGIPSMRRTAEEIKVNLAYRWFLGYGLTEETPHFSVVSKNYSRRFKDTDIFEKIFERILQEAIECGFVNTESIFIDGTHIKANANKKKVEIEYVKKEARNYEEQLRKEINIDRLSHGKKELKESDKQETAKRYKSTVDEDCGMFHKGEHERCLAYSANTACDKNGFVLGTNVTAGNIHDSQSFDGIYDKVTEKYEDIKNVVIDAGYKTPAICKKVIDDNRKPVTPYKRPMTKQGFFKKYEYVYDEYYDCIICPNNKILSYVTTNKNGYREYISNPNECKNCPFKNQCTKNKDNIKQVQRHIWDKYIEQAEDIRHTEGMKAVYDKRKETIERVFADAKEKHGMRYTRYRGLKRVTNQIMLIFACMNLKKLAKWKRKNGYFPPILQNIYQKLIIFLKFGSSRTPTPTIFA